MDNHPHNRGHGGTHTKPRETPHAREHYSIYIYIYLVRKTCSNWNQKRLPPFPYYPPGLQAGQGGFTRQGHFHRGPEVSQANPFPVNVPSATIRQKHILRLIAEHRIARAQHTAQDSNSTAKRSTQHSIAHRPAKRQGRKKQGAYKEKNMEPNRSTDGSTGGRSTDGSTGG